MKKFCREIESFDVEEVLAQLSEESRAKTELIELLRFSAEKDRGRFWIYDARFAEFHQNYCEFSSFWGAIIDWEDPAFTAEAERIIGKELGAAQIMQIYYIDFARDVRHALYDLGFVRLDLNQCNPLDHLLQFACGIRMRIWNNCLDPLRDPDGYETYDLPGRLQRVYELAHGILTPYQYKIFRYDLSNGAFDPRVKYKYATFEKDLLVSAYANMGRYSDELTSIILG